MDDVTLFLAIYGTALSTFLAIREITKERRRIRIVLQYNEFGHRYSVVCTNIGRRPITLVNILIAIPNQDAVPRNALRDINDPFPVTLNDGEHFLLEISNNISEYIYDVKGKITNELFDAEGKRYTKFKRVSHDEKFGTYRKLR